MTSQDIIDLNTQYLCNTYARFPVAFVRGEGCRLWDAEGKEYLDLFASLAVMNLGQCHPAVVRAVQDQVSTLTHISNLHHTVPQARLAELLGAKPLFLDEHEHDSYTSAAFHLPVLLSSALVNSVSAGPAWRERAGGWIRVMGVDVGNSMVIYTFATVAFYFLGAGILHGRGLLPQGSEMVQVLSTMYTETMGAWSLPLFLVGAFAVLYSTIFAATAAHSRVFADFAGILRLYDKSDYAKRLRVTRLFVVILLFVPSVYFMFLQAPVMMVIIGGAAQAIMLPVIAFYTVYLRYRHMPQEILPGAWVTLALWVSALVMALVMGYSFIQRIAGLK